ncbi:hypothetical protein Pelo_2839 [Pelomyxa schiedti]|nr:hypothetical protein Pelo_2839 [Pelomyxa schiedti]
MTGVVVEGNVTLTTKICGDSVGGGVVVDPQQLQQERCADVLTQSEALYVKQEYGFLKAKTDLLSLYINKINAGYGKGSVGTQSTRSRFAVHKAIVTENAGKDACKDALKSLREAQRKLSDSLSTVCFTVPSRASFGEFPFSVMPHLPSNSGGSNAPNSEEIGRSTPRNLPLYFPLKNSYLNPVFVGWILPPLSSPTEVPEPRRIAPSLLTLSGDILLVKFDRENTKPGSKVQVIIFQRTTVHPTLKPLMESIMTNSSEANTLAVQKLISDALQPANGPAMSIDEPDAEGQTLMHAASYAGNITLLKWLLSRGANIEVTDVHGWTPLLSAIASLNPRNCETALFLINKGASLKVSTTSHNSPLHYLCRCPNDYTQNNPHFNKLLDCLIKSCNVNKQTTSGEKPLHFAARAGNIAACTKLTRLVDDINAIDNHGYTVLHYAVNISSLSQVKLFLSAGALPDIVTKIGSPYALAQKIGNAPITELCYANCQKKCLCHLSEEQLARVLWFVPTVQTFVLKRVSKLFNKLISSMHKNVKYWEYIGQSMESFVYHACTFGQRQKTLVLDWNSSGLSMGETGDIHSLKFAVVGNLGVGKTTFIRTFSTESDSNPIPQTFKSSKFIVFQKTPILLSLYTNTSLGGVINNSTFFAGSHGIIFMFDIADTTSFLDVKQWTTEVFRFMPYIPPCALVGNKCDTWDHRQVALRDAITFAATCFPSGVKAPYIETSCSGTNNIDLILYLLCEQLFTKAHSGDSSALKILANSKIIVPGGISSTENSVSSSFRIKKRSSLSTTHTHQPSGSTTPTFAPAVAPSYLSASNPSMSPSSAHHYSNRQRAVSQHRLNKPQQQDNPDDCQNIAKRRSVDECDEGRKCKPEPKTPTWGIHQIKGIFVVSAAKTREF